MSKPITYTTPALPLQQALEEISKQAGVTLYPSDELAEEPVILRLKGVTTKQFMDRLAATMGAEWQAKPKDEFLFVRTDEMRARLEAAALEQRAQQISQAIKRLVDQNAQPYDATMAASQANSYVGMMKMQQSGQQPYRQWTEMSTQFPDGRALVSLLAAMDPKKVAAVDGSQTVVFANSLNRMQKELAADVQPIGVELERDRNLLADALAKATKPDDRDPLHILGSNPFDRIETTPTRFVLRVEAPSYMAGGLNVRLLVLDGSHKPLASCFANIYLGGQDESNMMAEHTKALDMAKNEPPAKLSDDSRMLLSMIRKPMIGGGDPGPIPDSVRGKLLNPETYDPLRFVVSDLFLDLAEDQDLNEIAYPSDEAIVVAFIGARDPGFKLSTFQSDLGYVNQGAYQIEDGWLTYAPPNPLQAWRTRTDRAALGACLRDADRNGFVSIDKAGALAQSERFAGEAPLLDFVDLALGRYYSPFYQRDKDTLLFYYSLDDGQRKQLSSGLSISALSKQQLGYLTMLTYRNNNGLMTRTLPGDPPPDNSDLLGMAFDQEPTEIFPDGVPSDEVTTLSLSSGPTYFVGYRTSNGTRFSENQDLDGVAYMVAMHDLYANDPTEQLEAGFELEWISTGESRKMTFDFRYNNRYSKSATLEEAANTGNERWTLDTLPPDVKSELKQKIEDQKRSIQSWHKPASTDTKPPRSL